MNRLFDLLSERGLVIARWNRAIFAEHDAIVFLNAQPEGGRAHASVRLAEALQQRVKAEAALAEIQDVIDRYKPVYRRGAGNIRLDA
jgi:hypothetical protein